MPLPQLVLRGEKVLLGKIHHLDVTDLWIQDKIRSKQIRLLKVLGADTVADSFTKYVDLSTLEKALKI